MKEFIVCAAIHIDNGIKYNEQPVNIETGLVIAGYCHGNCYNMLKILNNDLYESLAKLPIEENKKQQGFITSANRYVGRQEAWQIAKTNKQIQYGLSCCDNGDESILISENLY